MAMIKNIFSNKKRLESQDIDPSIYQDETASKISWEPLKSGGASFCTHTLQESSVGRYEYKPSGATKLFALIFLILGLLAMIGFAVLGLTEERRFLYFGVPFGSIFFIIGLVIYLFLSAPCVFDFNAGVYYRGRKSAKNDLSPDNKTKCWLNNIYAIQLIRERCVSRSSDRKRIAHDYYSYELNLVLKDGTRLNVIDHGKLEVIIADAEKLGQLLKVPVWNAA